MVVPGPQLVLVPCTEEEEEAYHEYGVYNNEVSSSKYMDRHLIITESLKEEKQISVDPVSLKADVVTTPNPNPCLVNQLQHPHKQKPPKCPAPPPAAAAATTAAFSPALMHLKSKFLSASLPSSATSSPRLLKKKPKHRQNYLPSSLARQHSVLLLSQLAQQQQQQQHDRDGHLPRSKSCGEGRASSLPDDFDLWMSKSSNNIVRPESRHYSFSNNTSFSKRDANINKTGILTMDGRDHDKFKCGALCLFLPGFGKGKPVRPRKQEEEEEEEEEQVVASSSDHHQIMNNNVLVLSRTVSLEKFECGSWTSSAILDDNDEGANLFFDLPLELIRSNVNDAHSPVSAAFVFDKDLKGVLKNGNSSRGGGGGGGGGNHDRKSNAQESSSSSSSRHVRFSTSSQILSHPTSPSSCITPRLRKARNDFNAFLEAQTA